VACKQAPMSLEVIGDGAAAADLRSLANKLELTATAEGEAGKVFFAGWMTQADCARKLAQQDCLILPSLMECGGAVVLEAMALGLPVIATDWGGPADYVDPSCGILVKPSSRAAMIEGLVDAMVRLAQSSPLRAAMGQAGRDKVLREFDWEAKVDRILTIYRDAIRSSQSISQAHTRRTN
jgi:glycosyltransferase involved in cell wall biosynthesis